MKAAEPLAARRLNQPEATVAAVAFLLNLPWEFGQMPFYRCPDTLTRGEAVTFCTLASVGDAALTVGAFRAVSRSVGSRGWVLNPTPRQLTGFIGVGLAATVAFEWLATEILDQWQYAPGMPTLPGLGTGTAPLLQWTLLPPLVLWLVRCQLVYGRTQ